MMDREISLFERPAEICYCVAGGASSCAPCRERREDAADAAEIAALTAVHPDVLTVFKGWDDGMWSATELAAIFKVTLAQIYKWRAELGLIQAGLRFDARGRKFSVKVIDEAADLDPSMLDLIKKDVATKMQIIRELYQQTRPPVEAGKSMTATEVLERQRESDKAVISVDPAKPGADESVWWFAKGLIKWNGPLET